MIEFLQLCFATVNLPYTMLLMAVFGYWILFLAGAVGLDALEIDFDAGANQVGEMGVTAEAGGDVPADGPGGHAVANWISFLRFFNVGDVPLMIVVSVFALSMWALSILGNHYLNPSLHTWFAMILLVPNLALSLLLTKVLTAPLRHLFRHAQAGIEPPMQLMGRTCIVTTSEVTPKFGQARLDQDGGPPILLNVRCRDGQRLVKGQEAVILEQDATNYAYVIVPFDLEPRP
jgi:hypothetical protein